MQIEAMQKNVGEASALLKSLANPNRLLLLCALINREHTVGELEALTGLSQSALSQHLARLREERLVSTRREAQRIFYALEDSGARAVLETLHRIYCIEETTGA
jgi:DNA-binding transcriptional ArsR family regulator